MTDRACPREHELLAARRTGDVPAKVREHLASCDACSLAWALDEPLLALTDAADRPMPSARLLFVKATLRREDARRQARRRFELALHASVLVLTLVGLALALPGGHVPLSYVPWVLLGVVVPIALWNPLLETRS